MAPHEAAFLGDHLRKKKVRDHVDLQVYTPEGLPQPKWLAKIQLEKNWL